MENLEWIVLWPGVHSKVVDNKNKVPSMTLRDPSRQETPRVWCGGQSRPQKVSFASSLSVCSTRASGSMSAKSSELNQRLLNDAGQLLLLNCALQSIDHAPDLDMAQPPKNTCHFLNFIINIRLVRNAITKIGKYEHTKIYQQY